MQRLSLAIAATSILMAAGCVQQSTTMQNAGAEKIAISSKPSLPGSELLGSISAEDGSGCKGFGHVGVAPVVEIQLRNQALAMGGDYVQVMKRDVAGLAVDAPCVGNAYRIEAQVYRLPVYGKSRETTEPLVLASQGLQRNRPMNPPPAVLPREMLSPEDIERVIPGEENWKQRKVARYVSVYSDEGRRVVSEKGLPRVMTEPTPAPVPAAAAPARVEPAAPVVARKPVAVEPKASEMPKAVVAAPVVVPAPVVARAPVVAPVVAPAVEVSAPPMPSPVTSMPPPTVAKAAPMMPDALPMPHAPGAASEAEASGVRQVVLAPGSGSVAQDGGSLSRAERDRLLEELAGENGLSYEEYQRRYRDIMSR